MRTKLLASAGVAALVLGVTACGDSNGDEEGDSTASDDTSQQDAPEGGQQGPEGQQGAPPEPDLEGIPDVVAEVNGEEIAKDEFVSAYEGQFQQMAMQAQQTGEELDQDQLKNQTAEQMVNNEMLLQEADNRDFDASEEDVDKTLGELAQQNGLGSPDEFLSALEEQGMAKDEVMTQLESQVKVDQLLADEAGEANPSDEELRELYDQSKAQQEEMGGEQEQEMPPFEELKPQLEEQVQSEKEGEAAQSLVESLREDADVDIFL